MIRKLRFAAVLACVLLFGAGCADTIRVFGGNRDFPDAHLNPNKILVFSNLPNLRAVSIGCRVRLQSVRITGTVVNDGPVRVGAFFFGGTAVSGSDTTQLPDGGVNNQVAAGLPARSAPLDVFLAEFPLSSPQIWNITFVVDPPDAQHPGGDIWELTETDNQLNASCICVNDPSGVGYSCSIGGGP